MTTASRAIAERARDGEHWGQTRCAATIMKAAPRRGGEITEGERGMITRIFDFGEHTAYDVMVPLSSVAAIDESATIEAAVREIEEKNYTRLPVLSRVGPA